jgi:16S rRNA (uracil1498-N3)-methyltransferase
MNNGHQFSLYAPGILANNFQKEQKFSITDALLVHRMTKVLRFQVADTLVLFDQTLHALVSILEISKKAVLVQIQSIDSIQSIQPDITFFLPLLKRDALETAVYALCELGVNKIALVSTEKSRKALLSSKEFERLQSIIIAAAEQSKNYAFSVLLPTHELFDAIDKNGNERKICFDPNGTSFFDLARSDKESIGLLVGPEAGLTDQELQNLKKLGFEFCTLTCTTLRAVQAVSLGAGLFRVK